MKTNPIPGIVYVTTLSGQILYHSRSGLTPQKDKATNFKSLKLALRLARSKYSHELGQTIHSWTARELAL